MRGSHFFWSLSADKMPAFFDSDNFVRRTISLVNMLNRVKAIILHRNQNKYKTANRYGLESSKRI